MPLDNSCGALPTPPDDYSDEEDDRCDECGELIEDCDCYLDDDGYDEDEYDDIEDIK